MKGIHVLKDVSLTDASVRIVPRDGRFVLMLGAEDVAESSSARWLSRWATDHRGAREARFDYDLSRFGE